MTMGLLLDASNALPATLRRFIFSRMRARCAVPTRKPLRRLLLDVSIISRHDAGTGIQRVVREIMLTLLEHPPQGLEIQLVGETRKRGYCFLDWDGAASKPRLLDTVQPDAESSFIGLDLSLDAIVRHHAQLSRWRAHGVSVHFLVYDLLPVNHPGWFPPQLVKRFHRWCTELVLLADSLPTISRAVERDIQYWLLNSYGVKPQQLPTVVLPMGADFRPAQPERGVSPEIAEFFSRSAQSWVILMVGTIEPRKGHAQVLDAFEVLWQQRCDLTLVIVGRPGWHTEALQARIRGHREKGQHLFWFDDASDLALQQLYQACHGVIIASFAEGFGLSLIEALSYGKPVLARDLSVFRERAQANVQYFSARYGQELAIAIFQWVEHIKNTGMAEIFSPTQSSWRDTAATLVDWIHAVHSSGARMAEHPRLAPGMLKQ